MVLGSTRHFATQAPKKGGSKLLLATLLGVGAVAGLTFNQTKATVRPALDQAKAEAKPETTQFNAPDFTPLKVKKKKKAAIACLWIKRDAKEEIYIVGQRSKDFS